MIPDYLPSNIRDVSPILDPRGAPGVVYASNGGGLEWVDLAAGTAEAVGYGMVRPWPRRVSVSSPWGDTAVVAATTSECLSVSVDGGASYACLPEDGSLPTINDVAVGTDADGVAHIFGVGILDGGLPGWCLSRDGAATWTCQVPPGGIVDGSCDAAAISPDYATEGMAWIYCGDGSVFGTADQGASWQALGSTGGSIQSIAGNAGGSRVFIAGDDGLWVCRDGGAPERIAFDGEAVLGVDVSWDWDADPTVFALVPHVGWVRSDDGGETFTTLPAPTLEVPLSVGVSPGFSTDHTVSVTTTDGAWTRVDRGETWFPSHALEVLSVGDELWSRTGDWKATDDEAAAGGTWISSRSVGDAATLQFRGVGVDLLAMTDADTGTARVSLDGGPPEDVATPTSPDVSIATLWSARDLDDAWHTVTVENVAGAVTLTAGQAWRIPFWPSNLWIRGKDRPRPGAVGATRPGA